MDALPVREFRRLDLNSEELGVPVSSLMARAGKALADAVQRYVPKDADADAGAEADADADAKAPVVFLCGKGNNGGDGFAAAHVLLRRGVPCRVVLAEPADAVRGAAARAYLGMLPEDVVEPWKGSRRSAWTRAPVLVDCLLGSGVRGRPRAPYDAAIRWLAARADAGTPVVSCDVPSGLGTSLAVRPVETVTFHAAKEGMDEANSGRVTVASIGIPARARTEIGLGDLDAGFRRSDPESHKGDNGRVLVVGGGPFLGAPHYAGIAAYRAGADLVHVLAPRDAAKHLRNWGPDLLVHDAGTDGPGDRLTLDAVDAARALLDRVDAVVVGPGLGRDPETRAAARAILDAAGAAGKALVVDADGLDALAPDADPDGAFLAAHGSRTVLTPHGGEFTDLAGWKPTRGNVTRYAAKHGVVVLRKGATDVVSDGDRTRLCTRGHPALTVGGTGDLLAGVVAALLARGAEPFDAACAGAYLLGVAGERAAEHYGVGAVSTDVAVQVARVLSRLA